MCVWSFSVPTAVKQSKYPIQMNPALQESKRCLLVYEGQENVSSSNFNINILK
jgi:hypothetical protein